MRFNEPGKPKSASQAFCRYLGLFVEVVGLTMLFKTISSV